MATQEKPKSPLTSRENLPPPRLVKNPNESRGRDEISLEFENLLKEEARKEEAEFEKLCEKEESKIRIEKLRKRYLQKAYVALRVLLKEGIIRNNDKLGNILKIIGERISDLEKAQSVLKEKPKTNEQETKEDLDKEFNELFEKERKKLPKELDYLKAAEAILSGLERDEEINSSDNLEKIMRILDTKVLELESSIREVKELVESK